MCGIAGWVDLGGRARADAVEAQLHLLEHRGPDSWGIHTDRLGTIGQTRLAVVDLVTGDPPITDEDGLLGVAFNGEIYNYRELRAGLEADGHRFRTTGDTEVLAVLASVTEPVELARQLDGMFGFAVSDARRGRVVLGRDRFGKKPLYYWTDGRQLAFASEIKALLALPVVPRRMDPEAIPAYLAFGYVPEPRTFYEDIRSVPAGHVLVLDDAGGPRVERYWDLELPPAGSRRLGGATAPGLVRDALRDAVARRMVADVPVGAFLSGGLDSSSVVAMMAEVATEPVRTFTIGFEEAEFDERADARAVARHLGTEHTEFVVRPDAVELMDRLVWHHDQPFGDSSALPTYLLSELTRKHVTVALCGDGGDEVLAGYQRFRWAVALDRAQRLPAPVRRTTTRALDLAAGLDPTGRLARLARAGHLLEADVVDTFREWITYVPATHRTALVGRATSWATDDHRAIWERSAGAATLDRFQDLTIRTYLVGDLLPKADRTSMAHGLEVRTPFLDPQLVDLAFRLRPSLRADARTGKRVLRSAMAGLLPPEPLRKAKWGFGLPLDAWFRGPLGAYADSLLAGPETRVRNHVDGDALDHLVARHRAGDSLGHALWTLCTLELFLRREGW